MEVHFLTSRDPVNKNFYPSCQIPNNTTSLILVSKFVISAKYKGFPTYFLGILNACFHGMHLSLSGSSPMCVSNSLVGSAKNNGIAFSTFSFLVRMYIFNPYPLSSMPPQKFQSRRTLTGNRLPK